MNLRNRTLILLGIAFTLLLILVAGISYSVTMTGLDRLEYTDTNAAVGQVRSAMNGESALLLSTAQDWGWWDDTAAFAETNSSDYILNNLDPSSLETIDAPLFLVLDPAGNLVYGRVLLPDFRHEGDLGGILPVIRRNPSLYRYRVSDEGTSGILVLPGGPMIVASTPILQSNREGPVRGTILMGRYLEDAPLQRIRVSTGYNVDLFWQDSQNTAAGSVPVLKEQLKSVPVVLVPDNESTITGYGPIRDLAGNELIAGITMERYLHQTGLANIYLLIVLLATWAVVSAVIIVFIMDHTVLRRIEILTDRIDTHRQNPGEVPAPALTGNDELAALERTILVSREDLLMSERRLRAFINALPDPAALYDPDGTILLANTAFAGYLGKRVDELKGTPVRDHIPPQEMAWHLKHAREAIKKKVIVQYEAESGGRTLLVSHYPVLDVHGKISQVGLLTFDISGRKRLENALQKVTKKIALLNTVIFKDIQSRVFVQRGYHELLLRNLTDPKLREYTTKLDATVRGIQESLEFARQYSDMGINPPRWQQVSRVMIFAISHLDLGHLKKDFRLDGIEIYADALLERVFFNIVDNVIRHAPDATTITAEYSVAQEGVVIVIADNGPGIPANKKEKIFEKGEEAGGSVGLFLAREILSITGITIRETGTPGQGARFEIVVPEGSYRMS